MNPAAVADEPVDVHAIGRDAEARDGRALHLEQGGRVIGGGDRIPLVAPAGDDAAPGQLTNHLGHHPAALRVVVEPGRKGDRPVRHPEHIAEPGEGLRKTVFDPPNARARHHE